MRYERPYTLFVQISRELFDARAAVTEHQPLFSAMQCGYDPRGIPKITDEVDFDFWCGRGSALRDIDDLPLTLQMRRRPIEKYFRIPDSRRQRNTLQFAFSQHSHTFEHSLKMPSAIIASECMHFVHDD